MKLKDLHNHTHFSFDSEAGIDELCMKAIDMGLDTIAITNHFDYDCIKKKLYEEYDGFGDTDEIEAAKERYKGKLRILRGIELGQPHTYTDEVDGIIQKYKVEYLLCSLHNLKDAPDFYYFNFEIMEDMQIRAWFDRYLDETYQMVSTVRMDTLAHIGYPLRYIKRAGRALDVMQYKDKYEKIFKKVIEKNISLEVNTSGLRKAFDMDTTPGRDIIRLYRECGGRRVSIGSDAHVAKDTGAFVEEMYKELSGIGFTEINEF